MDFDVKAIKARYDRLCAIEDQSIQSHAAAIAYSLDVPHLLSLIEEMEYEIAKLDDYVW